MQTQTRNRKRLTARLTVSSLRGLLIYKPLAYKPLAILMAILMLPAISWMQGGGAGSFAALAATAGWTVGQVWTDSRKWMSIQYLVAGAF